MNCSFSKDVILELQPCVQTNFHNARYLICMHTPSQLSDHIFRKEQSIASMHTISKKDTEKSLKTDRQTDRQTDKVDGWMDEQTHRQIYKRKRILILFFFRLKS